MSVTLATPQALQARARTMGLISAEPVRIAGETAIGRQPWAPARETLQDLERAEQVRHPVDLPVAYRQTCIDPRTGYVVANTGALLTAPVTHHGLTQLLARMGVPRSAHVAHSMAWLPTWVRGAMYEGALQSSRTLQRDAVGPAVVLRFAAGELRSVPGFAGFHGGFLDDLPVFRQLTEGAAGARYWRSFSESYLQARFGQDDVTGAAEVVSVRNSEVGSSSLSFRSSLCISRLGASIDHPGKSVSIVDEEQNGKTWRHTLPREEKQQVAYTRVRDSIAEARKGFAELQAAWVRMQDVTTPYALAPGMVAYSDTKNPDDLLAEILLDHAVETGKVDDAWRPSMKTKLMAPRLFDGLPWGSAAHMACLVAMVAEDATTATTRADASAMAGRWLLTGWKC